MGDEEYARRVRAFGLRSDWTDEADLLLRELAVEPGDWVLDVGCGPGYLANRLPPGAKYTGVDVNVELLHDAQVRGLDVHFLEAERLGEPRWAWAFDVVVMNHSLAHVVDPGRALRQARRVLQNGGRLGIVTPNLWYRRAVCLRNLWTGYRPDPTIRRWYTARRLWRAVAQAGLCPTHLFELGDRAWNVSRSRIGLVARREPRSVGKQ